MADGCAAVRLCGCCRTPRLRTRASAKNKRRRERRKRASKDRARRRSTKAALVDDSGRGVNLPHGADVAWRHPRRPALGRPGLDDPAAPVPDAATPAAVPTPAPAPPATPARSPAPRREADPPGPPRVVGPWPEASTGINLYVRARGACTRRPQRWHRLFAYSCLYIHLFARRLCNPHRNAWSDFGARCIRLCNGSCF